MASPAPTTFPLDIGTIDGLVTAPVRDLGAVGLLELELSLPALASPAGHYFLARCGAQTIHERLHNWQLPLRQPLFAVSSRSQSEASRWELMVTASAGAAYTWLHTLDAGATLNLIGPRGNPFPLHDETRNLLLVADAPRVLKLIALADTILDRGGRVTVVLLERANDRLRADLLELLPIAVEIHFLRRTGDWPLDLAGMVRWADQICVALADQELGILAGVVRANRLRQEDNFALVYPDADLVCGTGACLACVVPTAGGGLTRACVNGPVFDLRRLVTG